MQLNVVEFDEETVPAHVVEQSGVPPIYLINLDRSTDRLELFCTTNNHLRSVIRVPAVDGALLDRTGLVRDGTIEEDLPYAVGTLGSALSHLKLWRYVAKNNCRITIFEDAIVVSHHFEAGVARVLRELPADWDVIQWGYAFNPSYLWVDFGLSRATLECYGARKFSGTAGLRDFQQFESSPNPLRVLHSFGIMGYSISPQGARKALEFCLPLRKRLISFPDAGVVTPDSSIDITLAGLYPEIKAYICVPQLLIRRDDQSSVRRAIDNAAGNDKP